MNTIDSFITKQEYLLEAAALKRDKPWDFRDGFDVGTNWLAKYIKEILDRVSKEEK